MMLRIWQKESALGVIVRMSRDGYFNALGCDLVAEVASATAIPYFLFRKDIFVVLLPVRNGRLYVD